MRALAYEAPQTVAEAVALLAAHGGRARPLAGGTDLVVQLRLGLHELDTVVDVKRIPALRRVAYDSRRGLTIGAAVTCAELGEHPDVVAHYPGLLDGVGIIGGAAIQGRATLGGNLCNAAPSGDGIAALIMLGAMAHIAGPQGERDVPAEALCTAPRRTVLTPGELLVSLHIPPPEPRAGAHYLRFTPRAEMDIAVAGAGAWVRLTDDGERIAAVRIALSAVAPTPLLVEAARAALIEQEANEEALAAAAHLAREATQPIADVRGGIAQRQHLVEVLVKRALRGAIQRARGEGLHD
ncbi:MAG: xanthine dehydrogenase family protein subunit M [Chloroflexota bacterium]